MVAREITRQAGQVNVGKMADAVRTGRGRGARDRSHGRPSAARGGSIESCTAGTSKNAGRSISAEFGTTLE